MKNVVNLYEFGIEWFQNFYFRYFKSSTVPNTNIRKSQCCDYIINISKKIDLINY